MAEKAISELTPLGRALSAGDEVAVNAGGVSRKASGTEIAQGVVALSGDIVSAVAISGSTLTVSYKDGSSEDYTISGGGATGAFLTLANPTSARIDQLPTRATPLDGDLIPLATSSGERNISLGALTSYVGGLSSGGSTGGGQPASGSGVSVLPFDRGIVYYTGAAPAVTRSAGFLRVVVPADSVVLAVDAKVAEPGDASGTNTGYEVRFEFPTGTAQGLPYDGTVDQCPVPACELKTVSGKTLVMEYTNSLVRADPLGPTAVFPETFTVPGARRQITINFV